jgi:hypothetical protein
MLNIVAVSLQNDIEQGILKEIVNIYWGGGYV